MSVKPRVLLSLSCFLCPWHVPRCSGPGNEPDRRRKHIFMSVVFLYNYTLNCWVEKSKCPHPSRAGYLKLDLTLINVLHCVATVPISRGRTRSPVVFLSLLWPIAETAVPIYHTRHSPFFPSLFVSSFVLLSVLLFAWSGFLWASVTAAHGCKMRVNVLVKGLACVSWTLLMRTGRCGVQPTIIKLMWNVPVLIGFILQLYQHLQHKSGIMEKINKPSG